MRAAGSSLRRQPCRQFERCSAKRPPAARDSGSHSQDRCGGCYQNETAAFPRCPSENTGASFRYQSPERRTCMCAQKLEMVMTICRPSREFLPAYSAPRSHRSRPALRPVPVNTGRACLYPCWRLDHRTVNGQITREAGFDSRASHHMGRERRTSDAQAPQPRLSGLVQGHRAIRSRRTGHGCHRDVGSRVPVPGRE